MPLTSGKDRESLSTGFFLVPNHMPKIDCLANRISAKGGSPAEVAPPPP